MYRLGRGVLFLAWVLGILSVQAGFLTFFFPLSSALAKDDGNSEKLRDPRQLSLFIGDVDGSLFHNLGHYRLRRVAQPEQVDPFFRRGPVLPPEVLVPIYDFEGNLGPQIQKRVGRLDEHGRFIPSTSLEPILLSNGATIVPGYYFVDTQSTYVEFREPEPGAPGYIRTALESKLERQEKFLLEAFSLFGLVFSDKYADRLSGALLTMRGNAPEEWDWFFGQLREPLSLGNREIPRNAWVNLNHAEFLEFGKSKPRYLQAAHHELTERMMQRHDTPHFLVYFENDRNFLRQCDTLFTRLANQGAYANPVVPILVNAVEDEVRKNPAGWDWDRSPMEKLAVMSKVTVYWPGRVERSEELSRVLELTLQLKPERAKKLLAQRSRNPFQCPKILAGSSQP